MWWPFPVPGRPVTLCPTRNQQKSRRGVAVEGSTQITVGESSVFTADVQGVSNWVWVLPTGRYIVDEQPVTLAPTSAGTAEVLLRSQTSDGTELQTRHTVQVTN